MLLWAARRSGAVPEGLPLKGRGFLYLPRSARLQDTAFEDGDGNLTIHVACL
jgi:hypothetical protein